MIEGALPHSEREPVAIREPSKPQKTPPCLTQHRASASQIALRPYPRRTKPPRRSLSAFRRCKDDLVFQAIDQVRMSRMSSASFTDSVANRSQRFLILSHQSKVQPIPRKA